MKPESELTEEPQPRLPTSHFSFARMWRITRKELRETLRDRRTIATLLLMPLLVYPLLSLVFRQFLFTSYVQPTETTWSIGVLDDADYPIVSGILRSGEEILARRSPVVTDQTPAKETKSRLVPQWPIAINRLNWFVARDRSMKELLLSHEIDMGLRVIYPSRSNRNAPLRAEILYLPDSNASLEAAHFFEQRFRAVNEEMLVSRLEAVGASTDPAIAFSMTQTKPDAPSEFPMATLIPLILILMTITGAVYPAIDLTAGERERGTLETLVASPMSRFNLLLGKYISVLTVAVLTALMNVVAMTTTVQTTGLGSIVFGDAGLSIPAMFAVFGMMVLFASFFSALLLALTSFARSFKEAQAYLIPLMLMSMTPGFLSAVPGVKLERWWAVTPLANIVLLARDVLEGHADPFWGIVALASTFIYGLSALVVAAQVFGNDSILYGSQDSWEDWLQRPKRVSEVPTVEISFLTLAEIFPLFVWMSGQVALQESLKLTGLLLANMILTLLLFVGLPTAMAWWRRISWTGAFQIRPCSIGACLGSFILGCSLFPLAHELVLLSHTLGLAPQLDDRILRTVDLAERLRALPLPLVLVCIALTPAICEELFFRGFLFTALSRRAKGPTVILLTGVIFGLFHVLKGSGLEGHRLFSTTAIGCLLGWVAWRTRSIFPGMILHLVHNSTPFMLALLFAWLKWDDRILTSDFRHLPISWHLAGACGIIVGASVLWFSTRDRQTDLLPGETAAEAFG